MGVDVAPEEAVDRSIRVGRRTPSRSALVGAALVVAAAVALGAFVALRGAGGTSQAATAHVASMRYFTGIVRDIRLDGARLTWFGTVTDDTSGLATVDDAAYRIDDLDPREILVMRLVPGQTDGGGAIGDYLMLYGAEDRSTAAIDRVARLICPYVPPTAQTRPTSC